VKPDTKSRRQREIEERRQAILDAAWELFLEKGIGATTMDDIARGCQLSKGTLYSYFHSKDDISFNLLQKATDELLEHLAASLHPSRPAVKQLEDLGAAYYRFFLDKPESFRFMFVVPHDSYSGKIDEDIVEHWGETGKLALGLLSELLEKATAEGDLEVKDSWTTAVAFWSAVTGLIVIPYQEVRRPFLGEVDIERLVREFVRILIQGLRPAKESKGKKRQ
jgi:AcrR family transcriptional regulator